MGILIKGGTVVTSGDEFRADVLIEGEKIEAVGAGLDGRAEEFVDAEGKYIFPGGIDAHTHFKLPFMGTHTRAFDTTPAAIVGGTTCIVDFSPQFQGMGLLDSIYKHREEEAEGKSAVDFSFHAMVMDARESIFKEAPELVKAGIPTTKLFMAYKGTPFYCTDNIIFRMLQEAKKVGMQICLHAENGELIAEMQRGCLSAGLSEPKYHAVSRPEVVEEEAAYRATRLARAADAPVFVVHISCTEAMVAVREARKEGVAAYGETCPHYLTLGVENLARPGFEGAKYVCSPALRNPRHFDNLWTGLQNGWLQTVGSDHCGFNFREQKEMGRHDFTKIPNGAPGVENRLAILYTYGVLTGKLSLQRMVDVFATAPAKFNGLYPRKGSVIAGCDADLVVFDPDWEGTISVKNSLQGVDYNAYEGFKQRGRAEKVFLRGKPAVENGKYIGKLGQGKFIERTPYGLSYQGLPRE
jgi:dihydropyrimidinase